MPSRSCARRRARTHRPGMVAGESASTSDSGFRKIAPHKAQTASRPDPTQPGLFPCRDACGLAFLALSRRSISNQWVRTALVHAWPLCMSRYAELAVTTNYSFLRGASHPGQFVVQANLLGYAAI